MLLKNFFQKSSISIYYSTLETLAMDGYYANLQNYITNLSLNKRKRIILSRMREYGYIEKSIIYYISPYFGVLLFRLKHNLIKFRRRTFACF